MKTLIFIALFIPTFCLAVDKYGYLTAEDQKYYKNDVFEGNNQRERIDSLVIEMNKVHGQISSLKSEIQQLKAEIEQLKKGK
jgi:peptidoglycan hydrolase CwlO-like protein